MAWGLIDSIDASSCTDKPYEGGETWPVVSMMASTASMEGIADPIIGGPGSLKTVLHRPDVTIYQAESTGVLVGIRGLLKRCE